MFGGNLEGYCWAGVDQKGALRHIPFHVALRGPVGSYVTQLLEMVGVGGTDLYVVGEQNCWIGVTGCISGLYRLSERVHKNFVESWA